MPDRESNKIFIQNLEYLLKKNHMTYADLSKLLGLRSSSISMWKTGKSAPRMSVLDQIADLFGITVGELLTERERHDSYYIDDDARELVQFMFENPEYRVLFDASRNVKKEDIEFVKQMMDRLRKDAE